MEKTPVIALAGNPNSGKTTLFNLLTKSGEATGNRAGVTFAVKSAALRYGKYKAKITDLPGTYSLMPYGEEEQTAEKYIKSGSADIVIDVADATNLARSLFLATELAELQPKTVLALNMADEAARDGITIDIQDLSKALGIPVITISAAKNDGIDKLLSAAMNIKSANISYGFQNGRERSAFCEALAKKVTRGETQKESFSDRVDRIICKKYIGIPLFFIMIFLMFTVTFSGPVKQLSEFLSAFFDRLSEIVSERLGNAGVPALLIGLVTDGLFRGIGSVLSFLPQTAALFFILEMLEDTGYMARAAYVSDGLLRFAGLSGKAFIPFLLGFGCTVPAVMSTETLERSERKAVIYSLPFIPCSARLPVFTLIIGTFFKKRPALAAFFIYLLGVITAYISALVYTKSKSGRTAPPLTIELPKYRLPRLKNLTVAMKTKLLAFISRAGTVVLLCSAVMYLLCSLDLRLTSAAEPSESLMAKAGGFIAPVLSPIGIGDWRIASALLSGFFAKETIVSSLSVMCPDGLSSLMGAPEAAAMCVFVLLYSPCAATVAAAKHELGKAGSALYIVRCLIFAFCEAFLARTLFRVLGIFM